MNLSRFVNHGKPSYSILLGEKEEKVEDIELTAILQLSREQEHEPSSPMELQTQTGLEISCMKVLVVVGKVMY